MPVWSAELFLRKVEPRCGGITLHFGPTDPYITNRRSVQHLCQRRIHASIYALLVGYFYWESVVFIFVVLDTTCVLCSIARSRHTGRGAATEVQWQRRSSASGRWCLGWPSSFPFWGWGWGSAEVRLRPPHGLRVRSAVHLYRGKRPATCGACESSCRY